MTPRHHRVGPGIWDQPWDDDTRLVAIYLLTCKHRAMEGLYRLPMAYGPADMSWKPARFERAFAQLVADGFVEYDAAAQVVWLVRALDWQQPQNPNQVKAAVKALQELPPTPLLDRFLTVAVTVSERFGERLREVFPDRLPQPVANTPTPTPTPVEPPHPPRGEITIPVKPSGKRQRDLERFEADCAAYAAARYPGDSEAAWLVASAIDRGATWAEAIDEYVVRRGVISSRPPTSEQQGEIDAIGAAA